MGDYFSTVEVVQYSGDNISTAGDRFSTVEGIQYSGGYLQHSGDMTSVPWRLLSTVEIKM